MNRTQLPGYTIGVDAYEDIKNICPAYGKKAAIIGGEHALKAAADEIIAACGEAGIEVIGPFWYGGEASYKNVDKIEPKAADADMIFCVGGGKAIDTGKALAHRTNRPFFTFPTIASTCASCTSLAIMYNLDGSLDRYEFSKIPAKHIFINTRIIAEAPDRYLWAGIGDTMAKYFECTVSSRGAVPSHSDAMGIALSSMCAEPVMRWGHKAMEDCRANRVSYELEEVILGIIVSTGFVSNFVQVDYTTGLAHAVYNGFTMVDSVEHNGHLHGEIVAYGILILLTVDGQLEKRDELYRFSRSIGLPTRLADIDACIGDLPTVTKKALSGIDVRVWPYTVTDEMIVKGITDMEEYDREHRND